MSHARRQPPCGTHVSEMSALLVEDAADKGGVIHFPERLLVLAESLLQLVKLAGGRDGAEEVLRAQGSEARDPASSYAFGGALPSRSWLWDRRIRTAPRAWAPAPDAAMVAPDHRLHLPRLPGVAVPSRALLTAHSPTLLSRESHPRLHRDGPWVVLVTRWEADGRPDAFGPDG